MLYFWAIIWWQNKKVSNKKPPLQGHASTLVISYFCDLKKNSRRRKLRDMIKRFFVKLYAWKCWRFSCNLSDSQMGLCQTIQEPCGTGNLGIGPTSSHESFSPYAPSPTLALGKNYPGNQKKSKSRKTWGFCTKNPQKTTRQESWKWKLTEHTNESSIGNTSKA